METTYYELAKLHQKEYENDILLALADGQLKELRKTVSGEENITFLTAGDSAGMKTYVRGIIMVMMKAIYQVLDKEAIDKVSVEHSLECGLFC